MADQHELRDKGLRLTPQRELVLSAVRSLGHATPEEVAERVRQTHPGINLSTVYRNLETLENVGLVQHTHLSRSRRDDASAPRLRKMRIGRRCTD
jgi:Fur family ferric uptake transcriptional regulator